MVRKAILGLCSGAVLGAAAPTLAASVDAKLLGMLRDNGSITADQYAELTADLAKEAAEQPKAIASETVDKKDFADLQQKIAWATKTVVSGDVRVRQDRVEIDGLDPERNKDRQRMPTSIGIRRTRPG